MPDFEKFKNYCTRSYYKVIKTGSNAGLTYTQDYYVIVLNFPHTTLILQKNFINIKIKIYLTTPKVNEEGSQLN